MRGERGQTMVEFAIIATALLMLTVGLVDMGRAFFQYNAVSSAARFGARFGSVVGGQCISRLMPQTDWCNQGGLDTAAWWDQNGNVPKQGFGTACSSTPNSNWYTVGSYVSSWQATHSGTTRKPETIVGAIANRFDTSSSSTDFNNGSLAVGLDLNRVRVCIQLPRTVDPPSYGDAVTVKVFYSFTPFTSLIRAGAFNLQANATYTIESGGQR